MQESVKRQHYNIDYETLAVHIQSNFLRLKKKKNSFSNSDTKKEKVNCEISVPAE